MKLAVCLLFSLAALVSSDSSYSHYQQYQQYPAYDQSAPSASNYYQAQQYPQAQRRQSFMDYIRDAFFPNRRQAGLAGLAGLGPILAIFGVIVVVVVVVAVVVAASDINSSGRGLDTDEWEVDHSVWMQQLQKDFEESWSTE